MLHVFCEDVRACIACRIGSGCAPAALSSCSTLVWLCICVTTTLFFAPRLESLGIQTRTSTCSSAVVLPHHFIHMAPSLDIFRRLQESHNVPCYLFSCYPQRQRGGLSAGLEPASVSSLGIPIPGTTGMFSPNLGGSAVSGKQPGDVDKKNCRCSHVDEPDDVQLQR